MFYNIIVIDSDTKEVVYERKHEGLSNMVTLDIVIWVLETYMVKCDVIVIPINEVNSWE